MTFVKNMLHMFLISATYVITYVAPVTHVVCNQCGITRPSFFEIKWLKLSSFLFVFAKQIFPTFSRQLSYYYFIISLSKTSLYLDIWKHISLQIKLCHVYSMHTFRMNSHFYGFRLNVKVLSNFCDYTS